MTTIRRQNSGWSNRVRAASLHLLASAVIGALAALLVFNVWYPGAFRLLSGGQDLFALLVTVDVCLGPLMTLAVFDVRKSTRSLATDLVIIGVLQVIALAYGLHTVFLARPVAMVFEVDRFRVLTAGQINVAELAIAPLPYRRLPTSGPWLLGTRSPVAGQERNEALFMAALHGIDIAQRPPFWQPYDASRGAALSRSRPLNNLLQHDASARQQFAGDASLNRFSPAQLRFLPIVSRGDWVAVLNEHAEWIGVLAADGFF